MTRGRPPSSLAVTRRALRLQTLITLPLAGFLAFLSMMVLGPVVAFVLFLGIVTASLLFITPLVTLCAGTIDGTRAIRRRQAIKTRERLLEAGQLSVSTTAGALTVESASSPD